MLQAAALPDATTADGFLLVLAIMLPVAGILLSLVLGGRYVERIALVVLAGGFRRRSRRSRCRLAEAAIRSSMSSAAGSRRSAWRCAPTVSRRR